MKTQRNIAVIILIAVLLVWIVDRAVNFERISSGSTSGQTLPASNGDTGTGSNNINSSRRNAITRAVEIVSPAVVGISVRSIQPVDLDPFLQFFYGKQEPREIRGIGSGLIISEDGYIVTSDHVVRNAQEIKVTMTNGNTYDAHLVESRFTADIALLKIEGDNFPKVKFGNSDDIIIGEWAIALGNPFGLFSDNPTVSVGVVSAVNLDLKELDQRIYQDMIQTDAAVNPGNSGGPLINGAGEVIGINTVIYTAGRGSEGSIGISFAIPINKVKKVADELKQLAENDNTYWVGFRGYTINRDLINRYRLNVTEGFLIAEIDQSSPAAKAGLQVGDVITAVNGNTIRRVDDVRKFIDASNPRIGSQIILKIIRNYRAYETTLTIERAPR